ncbi:type I-E CRISPR-associated protein Cas7/Cse4/CasC [Brevibacterium moorei]|uniref:type I-E CRISPR-associated protein Cas7/Cse4/CasC n=1 Tax=Brevibacterium moorei TaxID=2968457 RepID=UPI00211B867A|nr:type I-E CRISPR-associated protein Cas7/Cse4/CasC [Brevibacterium sp. 68QC2CO]MCQ9385377.1 type I-E CRISPR-associated protein Cas7/Cse4/CasC [Brevibacterium sp. 68QC2CO]
MSNTFLDIHVLQSVPPSNLNRDDTGAPKTAFYGGVRRARVSSQAWKRATRTAFDQYVDKGELGIRTKRIIELLAREITAIDPAMEDSAEVLAEEVIKTIGVKVEKPKKAKNAQADEPEPKTEASYLLFFSHLQIAKAARQAVEDHNNGAKLAKKTYKEILSSDNSLDIALFGRMIADLTDLGVDAAAQVAHAISVHAVESEADFFTAVDDAKAEDPDRDAGAGMIGTVEFNSSTLYRYATVNLSQLQRNLGTTEAVEQALGAFAKSFALSLPTGKVNSFGNETVPAAVVYSVRTDRPISFVEAFEDPIGAGRGYVTPAVEKLVEYAQNVDDTYGAAQGYWTAGLGDKAAELDSLARRSTLDQAASDAVVSAVSALRESQEA